MSEHLSGKLKKIVNFSVALLGEVIEERLGAVKFRRIESIRQAMTQLRTLPANQADQTLEQTFQKLRKISGPERLHIARSFTLMLEIMNACENAYRNHQLRHRDQTPVGETPDSITYVLTAHPTEARAPQNIQVFHEMLQELTRMFETPEADWSKIHTSRLKHWIEVAWEAPIVRGRKPQVRDEADHIYSTVLREETLSAILQVHQERAPVFIRSWVGGDKDGHPGVDEKTFLQSLRLSRRGLLRSFRLHLQEVSRFLAEFSHPQLKTHERRLLKSSAGLTILRAGDGTRVVRLRSEVQRFVRAYAKELGEPHPALTHLQTLLEIFPALVVPLEMRESSDVLITDPTGDKLAIGRILKVLKRISRGEDPRSYARGFIISMAGSLEHIQIAAKISKRQLGNLKLPIIPLFEQAEALQNATHIITAVLKDRELASACRRHWKNQIEMMVGYSDSSKESGVLFSRLKIAENMHKLNALCERKKVVPVFFQGSGGSVDRGGGSVDEQTRWWPSGALRHYKVTVQGETVERSLASPEITRGQLERIITSAGQWREAKGRKFAVSRVLENFAEQVAEEYRRKVHDPDFLKVVEAATPYKSLGVMKFGSRPNKRTQTVSVEGLRAIPWVLCWTQSRVLFPTWWGIGQAWVKLSATERAQLKKDFQKNPLFSSYIRALGFTLLKVEMSVWRLYLEKSALSPELRDRTFREFQKEHRAATKFTQFLLGGRDLLPTRPWLAESVRLRSPMIHPLNLLQILAIQSGDDNLLRVTVAGISSGMMTTG